jgi:hypothetical protein
MRRSNHTSLRRSSAVVNPVNVCRAARAATEQLERRVLLAYCNTLVNDAANGSHGQFHNTQSETTSIVFTPNGASQPTIVTAFNDSSIDDTDHFTSFSRSTDGGSTFTDHHVINDTVTGDVGDPVLARDATSGTVYLSTLGFVGSGKNAVLGPVRVLQLQ